MNPDTIERIASHRGSHLRVLGPPASGKTSALVARFRALEDEGLRPAVITFSRAQRERLLERLMAAGSARVGRFPVHTYHRLALDVLAHAAPLVRPPLGDVEERVVLARVLEDLDGALESDFAAITGSDGLARALLSIVHTLEQNGIGVDDATAMLDKAKGRRTRDILRVFAGFEQTLASRGLCTYYAVAWRAARAAQSLAENAHPLADCDALLIDDFHDIDAGQFALIEALAPAAGRRSVTVFGDPTGARFGFRGTDARFLESIFPERYGGDDLVLAMPGSGLGPAVVGVLEGAGVEDTGRYVATAEVMVVDDLPLFAVPGPGAGGVPEVTLTVADDDVAEAQHVARACAALIDGGTRPGDIAVIARDRGRYQLVLAHAFDEFGVPLDSGEPQRHELETFADAMLGLLETRPDERLTGTVTDSPFYRGLGTTNLDDLVTRLRRECFDRKTRVLRMQKFLDTAVRPAAARTAVSDEAIAAVARMADAWAAYEEMAAHIGTRASIAEFRRRYRTAVSIERDPRCVTFHTAREAATHSFAVAFVVGCADGVFPALDARESYVPYEELESLLPVTFYEARDRDARLRDEYGLLLSALTRGRDAVHASAARSVAGEEVPAPARALEPLLAGAGRAGRTEGPRTRSARLVAAAGAGTDPVATATGTARVWLEAPLEIRRFAVKPFAMSPSRLGTYVDCPRKLFYTRILGIDEETTIYLTLGSLFHEVLEAIGRAMPSRDEMVARLTPDRIAGFVDDTIAASRDLGPQGSLVESLTRFYLQRMVAHVVAIDRQRAGAADVAVEQDGMFERGGHAFRGKIDRVDSTAGRPRVVIDYKTTKPNGPNSIHKTGKSIREYMLGEKGAGERRYWQVPMYLEGTKTERYPDLFCYYVVSPGYDPYVAGLFVSDDPKRHEDNDYFPGGKRAFATVSPSEIDTVMREVTTICDEIFGDRVAFPRTEDRKKCRYCSFNGVCERREAS